MSLTSTIESSYLWSFLKVIYLFFQSILTDMENSLITPLFRGMTTNIITILQAWAGNYGFFTPTVLVISIGLTFVGIFLVFAFVDPIRDMVSE